MNNRHKVQWESKTHGGIRNNWCDITEWEASRKWRDETGLQLIIQCDEDFNVIRNWTGCCSTGSAGNNKASDFLACVNIQVYSGQADTSASEVMLNPPSGWLQHESQTPPHLFWNIGLIIYCSAHQGVPKKFCCFDALQLQWQSQSIYLSISQSKNIPHRWFHFQCAPAPLDPSWLRLFVICLA